MNKRKISAALLMLGIIALGAAYSMNKSPVDIPQPVDTDITFPLDKQQ